MSILFSDTPEELFGPSLFHDGNLAHGSRLVRKSAKKLNENRMRDHFFEDTAFLGMVSAMEPYFLCWNLNNKLNVDFRCEPELTLEFVHGNETIYFPVYQYKIPNSSFTYILFKIRSGNHSLLPGLNKKQELGRLDYLLMVHTSNAQRDAEAFAEKMRRFEGIELCLLIELQHIDSTINLIF